MPFVRRLFGEQLAHGGRIAVGPDFRLPGRESAWAVGDCAAVPRPIRFVMYYKIFNIPVMRWIFRTGKAIPIAGVKEDPEVMRRAFDEVDAALDDAIAAIENAATIAIPPPRGVATVWLRRSPGSSSKRRCNA